MTKKTKPTIHTFPSKFKKIVQLSNKLEKIPSTFGTNEPFSGAEIHLVEIIGDNEGLSVTDIAKLLDITKGAVSQTLKKLSTNGVIQKSESPDNSSKFQVNLTITGKIAYYSHKNWHDQMDGGFKLYLEQLGQEKIEIIDEFLTMAITFLKQGIQSKK